MSKGAIAVKALVTGATGFVGSHLVRMLVERGYQVAALVRRPTDMAGSPVAFHIGDVRDPAVLESAMAGADVVFHTAGIAGFWGPWKKYYATNTLGTRNVVAACQRMRVPRLVLTSTPSVTFTGEHQIHVDESAPYCKKWLCHYQHSKALAEQHVLEANDPPHLATCALRPHLVWGPGDRHLLPRLIERARHGRLKQVGDGRNLIDITHVTNAAWAHVLAAEALAARGSSAAGRAYFISQGEPVNCWEWIGQVLALAGLPRTRQRISFYWAWRWGLALEAMHETLNLASEPRMTRFLAAQLARSHYYDISAARRDLGYEPQVTTEDALRQWAAAFDTPAAREVVERPLAVRGG
jgi:nucleoside-diphosphate-sugar epimerase